MITDNDGSRLTITVDRSGFILIVAPEAVTCRGGGFRGSPVGIEKMHGVIRRTTAGTLLWFTGYTVEVEHRYAGSTATCNNNRQRRQSRVQGGLADEQ